MKAYHNTYSPNRITKFDLSRAGENTITNINADNAFRLAGCFLGVWFSEKVLNDYKYAHEYTINDNDYMVLESLTELEQLMHDMITERADVTAYDLFRDTDLLVDLVKQIRYSLIEQGFSGVSITFDEEFGGESLIAIKTDTIL
jgi:hypothetical protein